MAPVDMFSHIITINGLRIYRNYLTYQYDILNLEVYDDDIWVATFPKSGTTWMQEMVWLIANNSDFSGAKESLNNRFPFLEASVVDAVSYMTEKPKDYVPRNSVNYIKQQQQQRPRFIKTHLPWKFLPLQIQMNLKKPKIIYVTRNPKDVCVSFYHHSQIINGYSGTLEDFCNLFLTDKVHFCPYWGNIRSFWERRNQDNIIFVKYEDMIADLPSVIKTVASFLDKKLNEQEISALCQHLSFNSMKCNAAVNKEELLKSVKKYKITSVSGNFIRSGKVGGYKSEISEEMNQKFDKWIEDNDDVEFNLRL